jgi:hypothetical protein
MLRSCGDINQDEFAINAVLLNVGPGDDENDGLPVRGDLRIGNRSNFREVVQFDVAGLRKSALAREGS